MNSIDDYKVGMIVYGEVSGIKPYGAFITFDNGITGLVHISEISNYFVKDISNFIKVGDHVMLKVIDKDSEHKQLRLSYKALSQNVRKHPKRSKFEGLPNRALGFSTIANKLPKWVEERENVKG